MTFSDYEKEIARLEAEAVASNAIPLAEGLSQLSQDIRSMCWRDRSRARAIAAEADAAAERVSKRFGLVAWPDGPLPIKGSVGRTSDSYTYGHRY